MTLPPAEPLHDRLVRAEMVRVRHPSQAEIDAVVEEAVEEERMHNRVATLEREVAELKEHKKLSLTAKVSIVTAIIGAVGGIVVVVAQGLMRVHDEATSDSVKQSKIAVAQMVASAQPSTSELVSNVANEASMKAIEAYRKQLDEQGYVIVPKSTIRGKAPK